MFRDFLLLFLKKSFISKIRDSKAKQLTLILRVSVNFISRYGNPLK